MNRKDATDIGLVSTVRLHEFVFSGSLAYETMIFPPDGKGHGFGDIYCKRYRTEAEALAGHEELVRRIREGWRPEDDS